MTQQNYLFMKPGTTTIVTSFLLTMFLQIPFFVNASYDESVPYSVAGLNCENAWSMDCQSNAYLESDFLSGSGDVLISQESCIDVTGQENLKEFWLSVSFSGSNIYYLDGYRVNEGIEIYTGSCENLELVDCVTALGDDTFIGFFPPVSAHYYIRLLGYEIPDASGFEISLSCGVPEPACGISIDNLEVGTCVNEWGTVSVTMWGTVSPEPYLPVIFAEVTTDLGLYIFTGESVNEYWEASFEVDGSVINYVSVFCGNSANGCSAGLGGGALPIVYCDSLMVPAFTGMVDWDVRCTRGSGTVGLYQPGTNILVETYPVFVLSHGSFVIEESLAGIYDVILSIEGFLPKGYSDVEISLADNSYDFGSLFQGDINSDGVIDILDLSTLLIWFNTVLPNDNSLDYLDQNCDGIIDIIDLTSIAASLGEIADTVPIE